DGRLLKVGAREIGKIRLDRLEAGRVVGHLEIGHPGHLGVDLRPAQLLRADVLSHHRLHEGRSPEGHMAGPLDHWHEVGQGGEELSAVLAAPGPTRPPTMAPPPDMTAPAGKRRPGPASVERMASWIPAPAESMSQIMGMRLLSANSRARLHLTSAVRPMEPA